MIHATMKAIAFLKTGNHEGIALGVQACDGELGVVEDMVGVEAIVMESTHLPDCPRCAVLWDEAQLVAQRLSAAIPA